MEQQPKPAPSKNTEPVPPPDNPATVKPYTAKEIAKALLNTTPKELSDWRKKEGRIALF